MLYVGIAVTFLTVWGVIMVASYLLRGDGGSTTSWSADAATVPAEDWITEHQVPSEIDPVG